LEEKYWEKRPHCPTGTLPHGVPVGGSNGILLKKYNKKVNKE
jgi:hypothetical protein